MNLLSSKHFKIAAVVLCVLLVVSLVCCSGKGQDEELPTDPVESVTEEVVEESTEAPIEIPTEATVTPTVVANMGTVITGELNIRKGADSGYEKVGSYLDGDRIEILETKTNDGTQWGRTNLGWVSMSYIRMDGPEAAASDLNGNKIMSDGNTAVLGYGIVTLGELNVRVGPGTDYNKVGTVDFCSRYAYYQLQDGWARIEGGWVSTDHFYIEGTATEETYTGCVNTDDLNIRTGPNTSFQSVGTYKSGDIVKVLGTVDAWAYTTKGWVFASYLDEVEPTYSTGAGVVTRGLNIRSEPNADSEIVGSYTLGETVQITEVQGSWGKTDKGWINLKFIEFS